MERGRKRGGWITECFRVVAHRPPAALGRLLHHLKAPPVIVTERERGKKKKAPANALAQLIESDRAAWQRRVFMVSRQLKASDI